MRFQPQEQMTDKPTREMPRTDGQGNRWHLLIATGVDHIRKTLGGAKAASEDALGVYPKIVDEPRKCEDWTSVHRPAAGDIYPTTAQTAQTGDQTAATARTNTSPEYRLLRLADEYQRPARGTHAQARGAAVDQEGKQEQSLPWGRAVYICGDRPPTIFAIPREACHGIPDASNILTAKRPTHLTSARSSCPMVTVRTVCAQPKAIASPSQPAKRNQGSAQ